MSQEEAQTTTGNGACSWNAMAQFMGCYTQQHGELPFDVQTSGGKLLLSMLAKTSPELGLATDPTLAGQQLKQHLMHITSRRQMEQLLAQPLAAMHAFVVAQRDNSALTREAFDVSPSAIALYQAKDMTVFTFMARALGWRISYQNTTSPSDNAMRQLSLEGHRPPANAPHFKVAFSGQGAGSHYSWVASDHQVTQSYSIAPRPSPVPTPHTANTTMLKVDRSSVAYTAAERAYQKGLGRGPVRYHFGRHGTQNITKAQQQAFDGLLANLAQQAWSDPATSHLSFEQIKENAMGQLLVASGAQASVGQTSASALANSSITTPLASCANKAASKALRMHQVEDGCALGAG